MSTINPGRLTYHVSFVEREPGKADALLTVRDVATRLCIGRTTVYELITSGELQAVKIGRSRRIPASAVDRFIASRLSGGP